MINAILINGADNVATAVVQLEEGDLVCYRGTGDSIDSCLAKEDVPVFHKIAIDHISKDAPIIKYGEHIGFAVDDIEAGQYVHVHNVYSKRENLKKTCVCGGE